VGALAVLAGCGETETANPTPESGGCANFRFTASATAPPTLAWNITVSPGQPRENAPFFYCLGLGNRRNESTGPLTVDIELTRVGQTDPVYSRQVQLSGVQAGDGRTVGESIGPFASGSYRFAVTIGPTRLNQYEQIFSDPLRIEP
jgi:hypothetical protein